MKILHEETLTPGVIYKILEGDIHHFKINSLSRTVVDATLDKSAMLDQSCYQMGKKRKALFVLDRIYFTPYMLKKLVEISSKTPDGLEEYNAVVGDGLLIRIFETSVMKSLTVQASQSVFLCRNEHDALAWLQSR